MRSLALSVSAVLLLATAPSAFAAKEPKEIVDCRGGEGITPDAQIEGCTKALKSGKLNIAGKATALYNRGNGYLAKGDQDKALEDYNEAIKTKADYAPPFINRGFVYQSKKQYDLAIKDYDEAVRLAPEEPEAFLNRGNAYYDKGDDVRAVADYDQAIKLKPDLATAYFNRGSVHHNKGRYDAAIADFDKYIELMPNDANGKKARDESVKSKAAGGK